MQSGVPSLAVTNQVRRHRLVAGLSQQALAEHCAIARQAIHAIETGRYVPNTVVALRLAQTLGCSVETLFSLPDAPVRLKAELLDEDDAGRESPLRVQVARVGNRVLATALRGSAATLVAADGLAQGTGRQATVDLLIDPERIEHAVVVYGCDPALALLGAHLLRRYPAFRLVWVPQSSLRALRALGRGEAHIAGTHLRDAATGECNLPAVRRELGGRDLVVITLADWQQGLIVAPGNPKGIADGSTLARRDVTIVNREPGSGSRMLLDAWLVEAGIPPARVHGFHHEVASHQAVAETVAAGAADAGPGIMAVARALDLGFVPRQMERYDLVIPRAHLTTAPVQALLDVAVSGPYRRELAALGGYDSTGAGTIVAELAP
ncbi:MAG: substrate-binding domain-containing protein [Chloroflexota bacterium]